MWEVIQGSGARKSYLGGLVARRKIVLAGWKIVPARSPRDGKIVPGDGKSYLGGCLGIWGWEIVLGSSSGDWKSISGAGKSYLGLGGRVGSLNS